MRSNKEGANMAKNDKKVEKKAALCKGKACKGKGKVTHKNLGLCDADYKIRRAKQTKFNNGTWLAKVKKGKAGHRYFYGGELTKYAVENPVKAKKDLKEKIEDKALLKEAYDLIDSAVEEKEAKAKKKAEKKAKPAPKATTKKVVKKVVKKPAKKVVKKKAAPAPEDEEVSDKELDEGIDAISDDGDEDEGDDEEDYEEDDDGEEDDG